jgi:DNA-binding MarR family transcriptional regulator
VPEIGDYLAHVETYMIARGRPKTLPELTEQQRQILTAYIRHFLSNDEIPPQRVIAEQTGIHPSVVFDQVNFIAKKGYIIKKPRKHCKLLITPYAIREITGRSPQRLRSAIAVQEVLNELN